MNYKKLLRTLRYHRGEDYIFSVQQSNAIRRAIGSSLVAFFKKLNVLRDAPPEE